MLYDGHGKEIPETSPPPAGQLVHWEPSDRYDTDESRALTPSKVDRIMRDANAGDIEAQAKLAAEIEEKNWDIAQALQTRRAAVAGLEWEALPPDGDDSALAKNVAADVEEILRTPQYDTDEWDTFEEAVTYELMGALLPGFAVTEIIWGKGGKTIQGFSGIEQRHFTFRESRRPLLVTTDQSSGVELARNKFIYHRYRARSGDATRGGLIRPLAWLDVFQRLNMKDLLRFVERYGMPFLVAKIDDSAWERDRNRIKYLIQNFGSDGGAVFTKAVETELLQAVGNQGDVYFRLLEYCGDATTKVVLGQLATSGDAGGFSKGQAQENVRQDLLEMDCRGIDATLTAQLARPWVVFNHGPTAPVPKLHHKCEPPEDLKAEAEVIEILSRAGKTVADEEIEERFGYKLQQPPAENDKQPSKNDKQPPGKSADAAAMSAESSAIDRAGDVADAALSGFLAGKGLSEWFGPLQVAIAVALRGEPNETEFRDRVQDLVSDLPGLYDKMDSSEFEDTLSQTIFAATAQGKAGRAAELAGRE